MAVSGHDGVCARLSAGTVINDGGTRHQDILVFVIQHRAAGLAGGPEVVPGVHPADLTCRDKQIQTELNGFGSKRDRFGQETPQMARKRRDLPKTEITARRVS